jgi:hypothetical protein
VVVVVVDIIGGKRDAILQLFELQWAISKLTELEQIELHPAEYE